MKPFMHENVRDGLGHGARALLAGHAEGSGVEDLRHAGAIDVDEGLDLAVDAEHPAERARLERAVGLLRDVTPAEQPDFDDARKFFAGVDFAASYQVGAAVGEAVVFFGEVVLDGGKERLPESFAYLLVCVEDDGVFRGLRFQGGKQEQSQCYQGKEPGKREASGLVTASHYKYL